MLHTVESETAGNTAFLLYTPSGENVFEVCGIMGDIGYLLDVDGRDVATRTIVASYISSRVKAGEKTIEPKRGWRVTCFDLEGKEWRLFVSHALPDRTLGLTKLYLVLDLKKVVAFNDAENVEDAEDAEETEEVYEEEDVDEIAGE